MKKYLLIRLAAIALFGLSAVLSVAATANAVAVGVLKDEIQRKSGISTEDLTAIEPELSEFSERDGAPEQAAAMVRNSLESNCRGGCLKDVMRSMNSAMASGLNENEARTLVTRTLREQVRQRSGVDLGRSVRTQVERELMERSRHGGPPEMPGMGGGRGMGGERGMGGGGRGGYGR